MKIKNKTELIDYLHDMHRKVRLLRDKTLSEPEIDHLTEFLLKINRLIRETAKVKRSDFNEFVLKNVTAFDQFKTINL